MKVKVTILEVKRSTNVISTAKNEDYIQVLDD